jgi:hypothetical protein
MAAFEGAAQGSARADELLVTDHLVDRSGAHPGRERLASGGRHECGLLRSRFARGRGVGAA